MTAQIGDKVRIKSGARSGKRGEIVALGGPSPSVRLTDSDETVRVPEAAIVNFSAAARKAWQTMPKRQVGRPQGSRSTDRVSVTLRIDRELWDRFYALEATGVVPDRTKLLHECLQRVVARAKRKR